MTEHEERCDLTELIKSQCGHCRAPARKKASRQRPAFLEAAMKAVEKEFEAKEFEADDNIATEFEVVAGPFQAAWGGHCEFCDTHFARGAWIYKTAKDDFIHAECAG